MSEPPLPRVLVQPGATPEAWRDKALEALREVADVEMAEPIGTDFVVQLGPRLTESRSSLVLRDEDGFGPEALGAGAVRAGRRSVVVRLLRLTADGSGETLMESTLRVRPWKWRASRASLLEIAAAWPAWALAGRAPLTTARTVAATVAATRPLSRWRRRVAELRNLVRRVAAAAIAEHWVVGIVDAPAHELVRGLPQDRVRWLPPPAGGFLADPMGLVDDETTGTLLAETFSHHERRGKIVAVDIRNATSQVVLERPWHLSYPFLLRHEGRIYCLPEMWEARRVQLFLADPFPSRWVEGPVLLDDFAGVDGTLHHDGERFWLFCADEDDEPEAKLWLFHSPELERGWRPHPWNPVRCDLRGSRPAGPLFAHGGELWRPAQDCTATYGGAVIINRVLELTPSRFREEAVSRLAPDTTGPYPDGLHTFCAAGPITLLDGKRHVVAPSQLLAVAAAVWRKRRRARRLGHDRW